ncbi:MAG: alkaline phosphatase family protein [Gemmatimonadales bacterium]|nr:alkaline phosphatase family protein [Gemmatimonadales bacterium]
MMSDSPPVILIGLDATEIDVVERLLAAGRLPNLAKLRQQGRWGRLQTEPPHFLSLVWSTFFCSSRLGDQGWYFNKIWNPDRQRLEYVDPSWLPLQPFWLSLDQSYRLAIIDLPYSAALPTRPNMTLLNGWQCHDDFGSNALPSGLWAQLSKRHGRPRMAAEVFGPQDAATLLAQRQEVLEGNRQFAEVCRDLMTLERFDLFLAVFGLVHRGSHYLWDLSQIDRDRVDAPARAVLEGSLHDAYASADEALGRVLDAAPADARVLVFALHGMEANDGWYEFLPRLIAQIHRGDGGAPAKPGMLFRLRQALPWRMVRQVTRRIPTAWNHALIPLWSRRMHDWPNTKYFALPMDYNGYIRLNLKGREREGCVDPKDADGVMAELDAGLRSFRDIESGQPVIRGTIKVDELVSPDAPRRRFLPDLIVLWDPPHPVWASSGVVSDRFGEIRWPKGRKLASGRSGNHTPHGWFIAKGPGITPGPSRRTYDTADLIPTAFRWLGAPQPPHFAGRPIEELLGD